MKIFNLLIVTLLFSFVATAQNPTPKVTAFNHHSAKYTPDMAFDGDLSTRWATKDRTAFDDMWIEADYTKPITVSKVTICEFESRVTKFSLEYKKGDKWVVCLEGGKIGAKFEQQLAKPVKAQIFRLNILERASADKGPTIFEISLQ